MSNQRTTQLNKLLANEVASGDLLPIIDVSQLQAGPTGETKAITAANFGNWIASSGILDLQAQYQASQTANGLHFSRSTNPGGDINKYCYTEFPSLGSEFTLYTRASVADNNDFTDTSHRVIFGAGPSNTLVGGEAESAYIGISGYDLVGVVKDSTTTKVLTIIDYFQSGSNRVFGASLSKDMSGVVKFVVNAEYVVTASGGPASIASSYLVMGCGQDDISHENIELIVYEAHVFNSVLSDASISRLFYAGANSAIPGVIASYTSENLNPGPTQWLDSVGTRHLLIPTVGASATNPEKKFNLNFQINSAGYLGNGNARVILPEKYVLTSCIVESPAKPLVAVGSSDAVPPVSASGTGSWYDNRVPFTSASYGVNPLGLLSLGVAHSDRTLYVAFSSSAAPCTFSFEGYVRN